MKRLGIWLFLLAALVGTATSAVSEPEQAADFLIVDCLLPAQVKQLGLHMTFLGPRQAIRAPAHECALRGGEFSRDGTGGAVGLQIWLPQANTGDATAQLYVGEIFERGLAGRPDYTAAAVWYKRAADQGNAKAQIALGALLEEGHGVPRDQAMAEKLFRRAAGLPDMLPSEDGERIATLSSRVASLTASDAAKQHRLDKQDKELRRLRQLLKQRESAVQDDRNRLTQLEGKLQSAKRGEDGRTAAGRMDRDDLAAREQEIRRSHRLIEQLNAQLTAVEEGSRATEIELEGLRRELTGARSAVSEKEGEVGRLRRDLHEAEHGQETRAQTAQQLATALEARERDLASSKAQVDHLRDGLAALETARQATSQLESERAEATLRREREAARQTLASQTKEMERLRAELRQTKHGGADQEGLLRGTVDELERQIGALKNKIASKDSDIDRLKRQLAGNDTERGARTAPVVPLALPVAAFGRYYALVIGINHYQKLPQLGTPINDAKAIAEELRNDYGFQVALMIDASRFAIMTKLNQLAHNLTDGDNLLIYYAGHGQLDRYNDEGNWLPVDAESDNSANWIKNYDVADELNSMAARQILVIADSCYGGTLSDSASTSIGHSQEGGDPTAAYRNAINMPSRVAFTSGGIEPVADNGGGGHSLFAKMLLGALRENRGALSAAQLSIELKREVVSASTRLGLAQSPHYGVIQHAGHVGGDFIFVRRSSM